MDDWPQSGLEDDLRPQLSAISETGQAFALVTVFAADGGPRGVGAQMVVTADTYWGFVSGGCIEADVALHARETLRDGQPRQLVYGRGSPWIDTRLPCGGRLDLLVERIGPGDSVILALVAAREARQTIRYRTDGLTRRCEPLDALPDRRWTVDQIYAPQQRLIVIGSDPIALAIASQAAFLGWSSYIVQSGGPSAEPGFGVIAFRERPTLAIAALALDSHSAVAIATHDIEDDEASILAALQSPAGYIGVLGSRRRLTERIERLRSRGVTEMQIKRLRMPIGLPIGASNPREIAVSVAADIIAARRLRGW